MKNIILFLFIFIFNIQTAFSQTVYYTLAGGNQDAEGSQYTLERNIGFFENYIINDLGFHEDDIKILFGLGKSGLLDVIVEDPDFDLSKRMLADLFYTSRTPHKYVRPNQVRYLDSELSQNSFLSETEAIFKRQPQQYRFYYAGHGAYEDDYDHCYLALGKGENIPVQEFTKAIDRALENTEHSQFLFTQCHSGGFTLINFNEGDKSKGYSSQNRCAFCSTVPSRLSTGCASNPTFSEEYSKYFYKASTEYRKDYDYNEDGEISGYEAHQFAFFNLQSIDIPTTTSSEFLRQIDLDMDLKTVQYSNWDDIKPLLSKHEWAYIEKISNNYAPEVTKFNLPILTLMNFIQSSEEEYKEAKKAIEEGVYQDFNDLFNDIKTGARERFAFLRDTYGVVHDADNNNLPTKENIAVLKQYMYSHPNYKKALQALKAMYADGDKLYEIECKTAYLMRVSYIIKTRLLEKALYESGDEEAIKKYEQILECEKKPYFVKGPKDGNIS